MISLSFDALVLGTNIKIHPPPKKKTQSTFQAKHGKIVSQCCSVGRACLILPSNVIFYCNNERVT